MPTRPCTMKSTRPRSLRGFVGPIQRACGRRRSRKSRPIIRVCRALPTPTKQARPDDVTVVATQHEGQDSAMEQEGEQIRLGAVLTDLEISSPAKEKTTNAESSRPAI